MYRWMCLAALAACSLVPNGAILAADPPINAPGAASVPAADAPITALPYTPGLDLTAIDTTADPCVDFYQYACGGWMARNPIPADQSSWSVYGKLYQDNQRFLWGILDSLARGGDARDPSQRKIGDYFAACMDTDAIEARGLASLRPALDAIDGLTSIKGLAALLASQHLDGIHSLFGFGSGQDLGDSSAVIAFASAGGLGLPDRDYYLKDDERSKDLRAKYVAHVERLLTLSGTAPEGAARDAASVMAFETRLAEASLTRVERRDPRNLFHRMSLADLSRMTPSFDWGAYYAGLGVKRLKVVNVSQPKFFARVETQLANASLDEVKAYLRWHVIHSRAKFLSAAFVDEDFDFYGRTLSGIPLARPRWKRCVGYVDAHLGEALGREFVARTFAPDLKARTLRMTRQIEEAMARDIASLDWLSDATKAKALAKLRTVANNIGYPNKWRDYGPVVVRRDDFLGNVARASAFEMRRELAKIGRPVDRNEWEMTPQTVNAYYDPQRNDINFPAGVLQPPLFDPRMDDAPNYGNTGGTIGHELTHGFDDEGRQFDDHGTLANWWTPEDAKRFEERAQCIVDQFGGYTVIDDIKINSKLTLGEDIADLGGLILAWMAWKAETAGKPPAGRDGMTPEQRFFVGYAQWACENKRPEQVRLLAVTDPHSPGKYRVNGLVANMPEFAAAFACKPDQPMVSAKPCRVW